MEERTQTELQIIIERNGSIRVGATKRIEDRRGEYQRDGYTGKMYYARTENMKLAENKLLRKRKPPDNKQSESNTTEEGGYVYVINGQRRQ